MVHNISLVGTRRSKVVFDIAYATLCYAIIFEFNCKQFSTIYNIPNNRNIYATFKRYNSQEA